MYHRWLHPNGFRVKEYITIIGIPLEIFGRFDEFLVLNFFSSRVFGCILGELEGGGSVTVAVVISNHWEVTGNTQHVTNDTWHMPHNMWQVTHDNFVYNFTLLSLCFCRFSNVASIRTHQDTQCHKRLSLSPEPQKNHLKLRFWSKPLSSNVIFKY